MTWFQHHWTTKWIALFLAVGLLWGGKLIFPRETGLEGLFKWAIKNYLDGKYREVIKDLELLLSYCDEDHKELKGKIYLLLGAAHEQLGNIPGARKNYQLSLELLSTPSIEKVDLTSLEEYQRIFMNKQKPVVSGIIEKPSAKPKKRKSTTLLLVIGGVFIAGVAALLVQKKDKPSAPLEQHYLAINIVGQGSVTLDPPGGIYISGTMVKLLAIPDPGWEFYRWYGDLDHRENPNRENPTQIMMDSYKNVTAAFMDTRGITRIFGHIVVFSIISRSRNRAAVSVPMPEDGTIHSITMYHLGGTGRMILAVYDGEDFPQNRLSVTEVTNVNSSDGWQTINLTSPASVRGGQPIWLAWVYENNPGFAYEYGSQSRVESNEDWAGGMPEQFGSGEYRLYNFSIYATYIPD